LGAVTIRRSPRYQGDGLADAAGAQPLEGGALGGVSLADVLVEDVDRRTVPVD
jgi:hypothetical protein